MIAPRDIALGILAGGRGTRLGGCDKAWIVRGGMPQVQRLAQRFERDVSQVLVSANRDLARFESLGYIAVPDRTPDLGPIGGLDALAAACTTPWMLTVPVDLVFVNDCLVATLESAGGQGACIEDDDGVQPLVALWNVEALRRSLASRDADDLSVQALQRGMSMPRIRLNGVRFGNLNTPDDLAAADARLP
ncbi:MAG: NTP transferase domain-containing protein [Lysobacter sp.]|nr:NTP transferase domain-containing protein [Lysobacter sp.]